MHPGYILTAVLPKAIYFIHLSCRTPEDAHLRLTTYTDYALRLLMYVAVKDDGLATISEVAEQLRHFQEPSHESRTPTRARRLRRDRARPQRRPAAGKPAGEIGFGDVVRVTEQDMALVPCFDPADKTCAIAACCGLRRALGEASAAFLAVLDDYTLADLAKPREPLRQLLEIEPAARRAG